MKKAKIKTPNDLKEIKIPHCNSWLTGVRIKKEKND